MTGARRVQNAIQKPQKQDKRISGAPISIVYQGQVFHFDFYLIE